MSKNGLKIEDDVVIPQVTEKKKSSHTIYNQSLQHDYDPQYQQLDLTDESKVIFFSSSFKY
jgi:hypothetical protein